MSFVADASALLCVAFEERGHEQVAAKVLGASVSATNWCEVLTKLIDHNVDPARARDLFLAVIADILPVDQAQAEAAARLRSGTRRAGLSLGDRACLALAESPGLPALTCDRAWFAGSDQSTIPIQLGR